MEKEKMIPCENCGKLFNVLDRKTRWFKVGCSRKCARILTLKFSIIKNKERRHKLRKEHRCITCGKEIEPIIIYPQHCPKHKQKTLK